MKKLLTICLLIAISFTANAQETFELKTYEENGKFGLLNEKGEKITIAKYDEFIGNFHEGLCSLSIDGKIGFINKKGDEVIPFQFSEVREFTVEGLAAVQKNGKWGFINKKGKEIIPLKFTKVFDFENGKALVIEDKSVYYIDVKGKEPSMLSYSLLTDYEENGLLVIRNITQQYGFLNGNKILPNFYDKIYFTKKGNYHTTQLGTFYGIIDNSGKEIIPPIYTEISGFDGKYFYLRQNTKKGIINTDGKIISSFKYDSVKPFKEGLARVKLDNVFVPDKNKKTDERYGFIDENGVEVIPRIYDNATDFINGTSKVQIGEEEFYINKKAERIK